MTIKINRRLKERDRIKSDRRGDNREKEGEGNLIPYDLQKSLIPATPETDGHWSPTCQSSISPHRLKMPLRVYHHHQFSDFKYKPAPEV